MNLLLSLNLVFNVKTDDVKYFIQHVLQSFFLPFPQDPVCKTGFFNMLLFWVCFIVVVFFWFLVFVLLLLLLFIFLKVLKVLALRVGLLSLCMVGQSYALSPKPPAAFSKRKCKFIRDQQGLCQGGCLNQGSLASLDSFLHFIFVYFYSIFFSWQHSNTFFFFVLNIFCYFSVVGLFSSPPFFVKLLEFFTLAISLKYSKFIFCYVFQSGSPLLLINEYIPFTFIKSFSKVICKGKYYFVHANTIYSIQPSNGVCTFWVYETV